MLRIQYMQDFLIISAPTSKRAEAYLEPSRSSGMELFRKNSLRIKAVKTIFPKWLYRRSSTGF